MKRTVRLKIRFISSWSGRCRFGDPPLLLISKKSSLSNMLRSWFSSSRARQISDRSWELSCVGLPSPRVSGPRDLKMSSLSAYPSNPGLEDWDGLHLFVHFVFFSAALKKVSTPPPQQLSRNIICMNCRVVCYACALISFFNEYIPTCRSIHWCSPNIQQHSRYWFHTLHWLW